MVFSITMDKLSSKLHESALSRYPEIRGFVTRCLSRPICDDENFFETGFVASMFGMQLIIFLEQRYEFEVVDEDLDLRNFSSLINIAIFVERKLDQDLGNT